MFTLEIHTENSAFEGNSEYYELKGILERTIMQLADGSRRGMLYDSNGNYVGFWKLEDTMTGRYDSPVKFKE